MGALLCAQQLASSTLFKGHPSHTCATLMYAGGIMAFLSFHELLPHAIEHAGRNTAVAALMAGMAIMSYNLWFINTYLLGGQGH